MTYLLFGAVMATTMIWIMARRHRAANDPAKSVVAFRRAIKALRTQRQSKPSGPK
ncbi:MAG: hypothetical protein ACRDIU_01885 [Actinomycetota bacterium]